VDPLFAGTNGQPWRSRIRAAITRWADWLIIAVTLLVIVGGILGLIVLPGR